MYRKRYFTAAELEDLSDDQIEQLFSLTDEQALDSDIGGDDDAEDILDVPARTRNIPTRASTHIATSSPPCDIQEEIQPQPLSRKRKVPNGDITQETGSTISPSPPPPEVQTSEKRIRGARTRGGTNAGSKRQTVNDINSPSTSATGSSVQHCSQGSLDGRGSHGGRGSHSGRGSRGGIGSRGRVSAVCGETQATASQPSQEQFDFKRIYRTPQEYKGFKFSSYAGINVEVDLLNPLKIFTLFFTYDVMTNIIVESNRYASQMGTSLNLFQAELEAFLGILIIMGFHTLPSMRLYWSNNKNFRVDAVAKVMPLKRFLKILRYLHINDNLNMKKPGEPGFDRLHKVRPLLDSLSFSFSKAFSPSRYLSVDESMIPFKGRSTMKQYMPNKPTKRGFKVWVICCALTGYMITLEVYEGKTDRQSDLGLGEHVVLNLSKMFTGLGYCLFFDRFFTSVLLLKKLLSRCLFACGTIQPNRKYYPKQKIRDDKSMKTGDFDSVMDNSISVTKWMDRGTKSVNLASNMHNPAEMKSVKRTNKQGKKETIICPKIVADYNSYMGGVDRFDQLMASYSVAWKSRRWWLKLFYYLLDASITNSFIIYKETAKNSSSINKPLSHLLFRSDLADKLISNFCSRKKATNLRNNPLDEYGSHFPEKITLRRCAYCCTKENYSRSRIGCKVCKVALCIDCYSPFHENNCKKINK